jgi:hypothetical protein
VAEQIGDTVLQRRQHRSFIENAPPPSLRGLLLSSHAVDMCEAGRGKDPSVHLLLVMKKDGTKRVARDIYEWLQQFCVEQCAVLLALEEEFPAFTKDSSSCLPLPCQLGRADGYAAPQLCMGCARWWTDQGWNEDKSYKDEPELFNRLVRDWRRTERPAQIVLAKVHPQGDLLFELVQPYLQLPPMATHFPCTREELGSFIEEVSSGEYPSNYWKKRNGEEIFNEFDEEDGLTGGYWLAHVPMEFPDVGLL